MSLASRVLGRLARLGPPLSTSVGVERDLEAKMPDGTVLLADRWYPQADPGAPVVLLRSPYGRRQFGFFGRLFAERGYQVVIQSCRGTFGSGGILDPARSEREDGRATLDWLVDQAWCAPPIGSWGPSYLGITQWAMIGEPDSPLGAAAMQVTAARPLAAIRPGGAVPLELGITWAIATHFQERGPGAALRGIVRATRKAHRLAARDLPVGLDEIVLGERVGFLWDWIDHDPTGDSWWDVVDFRDGIATAPPVNAVGGWYDLFLPEQLKDVEALVAADTPVRVVIGPWTHASARLGAVAMREARDWFDVHLRGGEKPGGGVSGRLRSSAPPAPFRLYLLGAKRWIDLPAWPPTANVQRWHLHAGGRLSADAPTGIDATPDTYVYDPANPTPSIGGPSLDITRAGSRNQRRREKRSDVLVYTSDPLPRDVTVVGPVRAELHLQSSLADSDFVVRLCAVSTRGKSVNISDGVIRLRGRDETGQAGVARSLVVDLWPTAATFKAGQRIRLQVSSGAHPLYGRNPGTGDEVDPSGPMQRGHHTIFHDQSRPSGIDLPIFDI